MASADEVVKIGKKLDKMVSSGTTDDSSASDLLVALKKFPMNFDLLQKTRIGMKVNNFRKACTNDSMVSASKGLIKQWKKLLPESGSQSSSGKSSSNPIQRSNSSSSLQKDEDSRDSPNSETNKPETPTTPTTPTSPNRPDFLKQLNMPRADDTTDPTRLKCRELIGNALRTPPMPDGSLDPEDLAGCIEDAIFNEFGNTGTKYKSRARSRVANLKDTKNPHLRENVIIGSISAERIAVMTSEEMASDELKEQRAKFTKESINDHQMAKQSGTTSSIFKCGRCGKRNCTYNQVQTRSADEPMTTFVLCNDCGNRWKFC